MNEYLIVAASSVYWAMDEKPHLFGGLQNKVFSVPGLALNHANKEKNIEVLLRTHKIPTKSNKIIFWHDAVNNSLSSKKNPALTPYQFFSKVTTSYSIQCHWLHLFTSSWCARLF